MNSKNTKKSHGKPDLKTTNEDVFKVQRPMGGPGPVLVYNRSRDVYAQMPLTPDLAAAMGNQYKIYVRAYINSDGVLQIIEHLGWQPW